MSPSALFVTTVPITLEAFLLPFAAHFRARGWRIDALSNAATQHAPLLGAFDNIYDITWSRNPLAISDHFDTWERVRRIVVEGGYDIVHVHTPIAAFVTRFALRSMPAEDRPAIVYTAHGFHFYRGQSRKGHTVFHTMERSAARWTDYLVTINAEDYDAALGFGTIPPERVRHIPGIGVDTARYAPDAVTRERARELRRELDVPDDAFMLTAVAEFSPVKRHTHLLQALARVQDPRVVLVLVGEGPLEAETRSFAEEIGVADRVRWAGYRHDVPAVLDASDAVALVSQREGLPRSVLEAMSSAVPVIGTETRGIVDLVGEDAGWIAPKTDVDALARAIEAAAADPDEARRRGAAGRDRAVREYDIVAVLSAYDRLYTEALESRA